jgi:hypothetical protein
MRPVVLGDEIFGDIQVVGCINNRNTIRIDQERYAARLRVSSQSSADVFL